MLVLCSLVVQVACSPADLPFSGSTTSLSPPQARTDSLPVATIGDHSFSLEIADTPDERALGLMRRTTLPLETAMLFVFDTERTWPFWMKNTSILLDILWVNSSGKIVDIQTMYPEPGKPDKDLTVYEPASPALYALEINGGLAKKYGFSLGTLVRLNLRANRPD